MAHRGRQASFHARHAQRGPFVRQSLLARLRRKLGLPGSSPIHRIDRNTAGLVAFAVQPASRAACQQFF